MVRILILMVLVIVSVNAKVVTVHARGNYLMTSSDTKEDGRGYALMYAKMNAVEEAGTILRSVFKSYTRINGKKTASRDLQSYSAALLKTTVTSVKYRNGFCKVKITAKINTSDVDKFMKEESGVKRQIKGILKTQKSILKDIADIKKTIQKNNPRMVILAKLKMKNLKIDYSNNESEMKKIVLSVKALRKRGKSIQQAYQEVRAIAWEYCTNILKQAPFPYEVYINGNILTVSSTNFNKGLYDIIDNKRGAAYDMYHSLVPTHSTLYNFIEKRGGEFKVQEMLKIVGCGIKEDVRAEGCSLGGTGLFAYIFNSPLKEVKLRRKCNKGDITVTRHYIKQ